MSRFEDRQAEMLEREISERAKAKEHQDQQEKDNIKERLRQLLKGKGIKFTMNQLDDAIDFVFYAWKENFVSKDLIKEYADKKIEELRAKIEEMKNEYDDWLLKIKKSPLSDLFNNKEIFVSDDDPLKIVESFLRDKNIATTIEDQDEAAELIRKRRSMLSLREIEEYEKSRKQDIENQMKGYVKRFEGIYAKIKNNPLKEVALEMLEFKTNFQLSENVNVNS